MRYLCYVLTVFGRRKNAQRTKSQQKNKFTIFSKNNQIAQQIEQQIVRILQLSYILNEVMAIRSLCSIPLLHISGKDPPYVSTYFSISFYILFLVLKLFNIPVALIYCHSIRWCYSKKTIENFRVLVFLPGVIKQKHENENALMEPAIVINLICQINTAAYS